MQDVIQVITELITQGYLGLFIACFIINMIPFLSPSNMVLAGVAALLLPTLNWILIGVIVATAATIAKAIHYFVVRGSRVVMSEERLRSIDKERERVEKWGALALFIAAASPVPDDPLIVYVGFTKYSVPKFLVSYYVGKVSVTLAGAFIGYSVGSYFESLPIVIASIALTAILTGILFKRKTEGEDSDMQQDHRESASESEPEKSQNDDSSNDRRSPEG
ncbi:MAG: DedA family protein [Candidatus Thorarchaeota archaeon]|jgi:uncharacterized membrane protein YdjX (TVP38/TMEM64 family)